MLPMCWYTFTFARPFQWDRLSLRRTDSDSLKFKLRGGGLCAAELAVVRRLCPANTYNNNNKKRPHQTTLASNAGSGGLRCVLIAVVFLLFSLLRIMTTSHHKHMQTDGSVALAMIVQW